MDIASPAAPAAPLSAPPSSGSQDPFDSGPPWQSEARAAQAIRRCPLDSPRIEPQRVPWTVVVLTMAIGLFLAFGTRAGGIPDGHVMTFASAEVAD